jgi:hypothetical protein
MLDNVVELCWKALSSYAGKRYPAMLDKNTGAAGGGYAQGIAAEIPQEAQRTRNCSGKPGRRPKGGDAPNAFFLLLLTGGRLAGGGSGGFFSCTHEGLAYVELRLK